MFNVQNLKNHFPILSNDSSLTYFDNASTTHKPKVVIDKISEFILAIMLMFTEEAMILLKKQQKNMKTLG